MTIAKNDNVSKIMNQHNPSKRHHYLPVHYLDGFTNGGNSFFVYDKQKERIFPTNPRAAFFENNLNTVIFPDGSSSDFLEDLYTDLENGCWGSIDTIRRSTYMTPINLLDKMHLFLFILFLYWRLPSNIEFAEKMSEKAFVDDNELDYFRLVNKSGEKAPQEVVDRLKQSDAFKKAFRQVIPLVPFFKDKDWAAKLEKWRFVYTGDEKRWNIVGDNPIIVRKNTNHGLVDRLEEFVFPISGNILLINVNKPLNKGLPPEFTIENGAAIIEQSQRFVACQNKSFLEALIKYHKVYIHFGKTNQIVSEMFDMLEK